MPTLVFGVAQFPWKSITYSDEEDRSKEALPEGARVDAGERLVAEGRWEEAASMSDVQQGAGEAVARAGGRKEAEV
jgi:hypothetical protein